MRTEEAGSGEKDADHPHEPHPDVVVERVRVHANLVLGLDRKTAKIASERAVRRAGGITQQAAGERSRAF